MIYDSQWDEHERPKETPAVRRQTDDLPPVLQAVMTQLSLIEVR